MATRNWWISAAIDGRKTEMSGGPQDKDGGFSMTIFQRSEGQGIMVAKISGFATDDGKLSLTVRVNDGVSLPIVGAFDTDR